ncbi:MAG: GNAT family N-acetyltransferase [Dehalococcoidia bacterium]|nr:GNAT family N-acetyltransferase [Dehalococcoidia bacterium]
MSTVQVLATADLTAQERRAIRALLTAAFEDGFTDDDWDHTLGGLHVIIEDGDAIVAHAAVVPRTLKIAGRPVRAGYVEGVATDATRQRQGLGSLAMSELARVLRREFEMGALSSDRHHFYERLGWQRWRGPTYVRDGDRIIRTAHEDDGIMALVFGPTEQMDLTAPIICEARSGDDW